MLSITNVKSRGQIYNVIDFDHIDKKKYINFFLKRLHPKANFYYVSYSLLYALLQAYTFISIKLFRNISAFYYRFITSQRAVIYDANKIQNELQWSQKVTFENAIEEILKLSR
jgi:nucleoside-diphosphate-sugar epimerase